MKACLLVIDAQESLRSVHPFEEDHLVAYLKTQNRLIAWSLERGIPIVRIFQRSGPFSIGNPWSVNFGTFTPLEGLLNFEASRVIYKERSSALVHTGLRDWLDQRGITRVLISGLRTEQACESTARHASDLGYDVWFVLDATLTCAFQDEKGDIVATANDVKQRTSQVLSRGFAQIVSMEHQLAFLRN